jgi:hypothetical protein
LAPDLRRLLLDLGTFLGVSLGNIIIFGERMGKNKSEAYDTYHDPYPVADPAFGL